MGEHQNRSTAQEVIDFYSLTPKPQKNDKEFTPIYPLPVHSHELDKENKIRICACGYHKKNSDPLILMVVGPSGSGKSTAINALVNYLLDVQYEHNYRFELVNLEKDEEGNAGNQTYSQTKWVTVYKIYEFKNSPVKRPIFIVDTPGLDDTDGKEKDEQTVRQMKLLFENHLSAIHAVCITLNGTQARLNANQKYIFDSINKIFGKDIVNNLYIWATFTDLTDPPVVASLKEYKIQYEKLCTIENGTLYKNIPEDTREAKKCKNKFEDVYEFFNEFFNTILLNKRPISLENTKIVLQERENTESIKKEIEHEIVILINQYEEKSRLKNQLIQHKKEFRKSRNFSFKVRMFYQNEDRKNKVNNCLQCRRTCCNPCSHNAMKKWMFQKCSKITYDGYCKVCRCGISFHSRSRTERYEEEEKSLIEIDKLERTDKDSIIIDEGTQNDIRDLKGQLDQSSTDISGAENFISKLERYLYLLGYKLEEKVKKLQANINRIKELALYQENQSLTEIINEIKLNDENHNEDIRSECYQILEQFAEKISAENLTI